MNRFLFVGIVVAAMFVGGCAAPYVKLDPSALPERPKLAIAIHSATAEPAVAVATAGQTCIGGVIGGAIDHARNKRKQEELMVALGSWNIRDTLRPILEQELEALHRYDIVWMDEILGDRTDMSARHVAMDKGKEALNELIPQDLRARLKQADIDLVLVVNVKGHGIYKSSMTAPTQIGLITDSKLLAPGSLEFIWRKTSNYAKIERVYTAVYLKNGTRIAGTITEIIPGKALKIQTPDGNISAVSWDQLDTMRMEPLPPPGKATLPDFDDLLLDGAAAFKVEMGKACKTVVYDIVCELSGGTR